MSYHLQIIPSSNHHVTHIPNIPGATNHGGLIAGWFLALFVWFVVYVVQRMLWDAQKRFVQMRIAWLQHHGAPWDGTICCLVY